VKPKLGTGKDGWFAKIPLNDAAKLFGCTNETTRICSQDMQGMQLFKMILAPLHT